MSSGLLLLFWLSSKPWFSVWILWSYWANIKFWQTVAGCIVCGFQHHQMVETILWYIGVVEFVVLSEVFIILFCLFLFFSFFFLFFVTEIEKRTTVSVPDVISIERTNEFFRILYDSKGRFVVHRIKPEEAKVRRGFLDSVCFTTYSLWTMA